MKSEKQGIRVLVGADRGIRIRGGRGGLVFEAGLALHGGNSCNAFNVAEYVSGAGGKLHLPVCTCDFGSF